MYSQNFIKVKTTASKSLHYTSLHVSLSWSLKDASADKVLCLNWPDRVFNYKERISSSKEHTPCFPII